MSFELISASYPRARKQYACEWCGQKIEVGEKHYSRTFRFDGFQTGRMHLECEKAMRDSNRDELSDGWSFGEMARGVPV